MVSRVWALARAWSGMYPGPQTGACGKMMLVHVGVNPRSVRALCVPIRHEGSIFIRMECEFAHGVFASDLRMHSVCACFVSAWFVWSVGL